MDIIFVKVGEYKNDDRNIVVTDEDVKKRKVFPVVEKNYVSYVKKGLAVLAKEIKADEPEDDGDLSKLTIPKLKEYCENHDPIIDLGDIKKKDDILEAIKKAHEPIDLDTGTEND